MLISDNAKTFRSASKEIQALSRSQDVLSHLANNQAVVALRPQCILFWFSSRWRIRKRKTGKF